MKPQIIVCGLGRTGYRIFSLLKQQGAQVVGIHYRPISNADASIIVGDMRAATTLLAAGIREAHTLLLANSDDALNLAILTQARLLNPQIRIINRLFSTSLGDRLDSTLPHHVSMSVAALAAPLFAFAALGNRAIGQIRLMNRTWPIHEEYIDDDHPWNGRQLRELWENRSRMLIYYLPKNQSIDLVSAVVQNKALQTGDRLIVATKPSLNKRQINLLQRLQRFFVSFSHFRRQSRVTLLVLLVLFMTIFAATLTYISVNFNTSFVDALYFSVGMITGAGGLEEVAEKSSGLIKVFTATMMLVGAGVIGICYALLNDYVLGARFQQVLNAARLPHHHHYVICGLGGVGFQIAHQLKLMHQDVVVLERDPNNRFLNAARSLKIPVVIGDASVDATLETAHIQQAAALLAVTSDDTINLEVALTAKSLAPRLAVVVRNQDAEFAQQVQQVFEFERVMSPTDLAAPAFAAAALGGRILGNGMTANSLWVAIATLITLGHPFYGKSIREAAAIADFVPLYVESPQAVVHGLNLLEYGLSENDVLYLTMPANRIEQLWRTSLLSLMAS
ncbi:MAG: potassium channel protein [Leptolyngbyaceae cyanobacterium RM1_1_2]|nr:potassium channel protein [Leptolyngbyaceae cyanobacterium RM1_1_2]